MPELFGKWLHAVIYTGIVCSIAMLLTPEGRVKKALAIICAVVMCAAVASPIAKLDFDAYSKAMARYELDAEKYIGKGEDYSKNLNRSIIEDKCRAYILDKADEIGAELSEVTVTAQWSSDGYWYPHEAEIVSSAADDQKSRLSDYIKTQLGISISDQNWSDEANDR